MKRRVVLVGLLVLTTTGCWLEEPRTCTAVAGLEGVRVGVPHGLVPGPATVHVEACDDDRCVTQAARLMTPPIAGPGDEPREVWFQAADFLALLDSERLMVTTEIRSHGDLLLRKASTEAVDREWPNGTACDGEGYASVSVVISADDLVEDSPTEAAAPRSPRARSSLHGEEGSRRHSGDRGPDPRGG